MPNWVSVLGKWVPKPEYVVDPKAAKGKEVYEGPDRAATQTLKEQEVDHLGQDYKMDPDLIRKSRELGYKDVDEYLREMHGFDKEAALIKAKANLGEVEERPKPKRKRAVRPQSGGDDTSGQGKHMKGEFDLPPGVSSEQVKQRG